MKHRKIFKPDFASMVREKFQDKIQEYAVGKDDIYDEVSEFLETYPNGALNDLANVALDAIANALYESMAQANEQESIKISLFDGMDVESVYVPQKEKKNNLTGETITVASKIKPKATFTRTCIEKLSESVR